MRHRSYNGLLGDSRLSRNRSVGCAVWLVGSSFDSEPPVSVYIGLYLRALPILCLFVAWKLVSVIFRVIAVRAEGSKDNAQ